MKEHWRKLSEKIDALALRERALIFLMLTVLLITPINLFLLDPLRTKQKALTEELRGRQSQLADLQSQLQGIAVSSRINPDFENIKRLQELKRKYAELEAPLESVQQSLVSSGKQISLLADLLAQNPHLKLVSIKSLPVSSVLESQSAPQAKKGGGAVQATSLVYKHGMQLVIEGGYQDLAHYLSVLERLPWRVVWGEAEWRVQEHPRILLTLTLYTLSLEKIWLSV